MRDSASVISQAVRGIDIDELAFEMDVSVPRMYEILAKDNPLPRTKKLIRAIGKLSKAGARLIKTDLDSLFVDVLGDELANVSEIDLHREAFEAVQACLEGKSVADRKRELRELITVAQMMLENVGRNDDTVRTFARKAVAERKG